MTKLQTPCVVCKTSIYIADNASRETALCTSCRRQGKAPKKRARRCTKCKTEITPGNASLRPSLCLACYAKTIEAELARAKAELEREKRKTIAALSARDDDYLAATDTSAFGGFPWGSATTNPLI